MPVASPLADPPPSAAQLIEVLATLGRPVTVHSGDPAPTVLHLARLLVAVAERHAIAAELVLGAEARGGRDVDKHQETYDTASVRAAFELESKIRQGYVSRMTAGFCWPWSAPRPDGSLVDDVVIGPWRRPWNLRSDKPLNGIPSSSLWATQDTGFGQVGCVYTAQGFEYDYGGVILGGDMTWREDHWVPDRAASRDSALRKADNFGDLVRSTYKVLLTRGLMGCVIYSADPQTQQMLAGLGIPQLLAAASG